MIEPRNILRQITDIQVQADRLVKGKGDLTEIEDFAQFSHELRTYLGMHIKDDYVLEYVNAIPILDLDVESEPDDGFLESLLFFLVVF